MNPPKSSLNIDALSQVSESLKTIGRHQYLAIVDGENNQLTVSNLELVEAMLKKGANLNIEDNIDGSDKKNALYYALQKQDLPMIQLLIEKGNMQPKTLKAQIEKHIKEINLLEKQDTEKLKQEHKRVLRNIGSHIGNNWNESYNPENETHRVFYMDPKAYTQENLKEVREYLEKTLEELNK